MLDAGNTPRGDTSRRAFTSVPGPLPLLSESMTRSSTAASGWLRRRPRRRSRSGCAGRCWSRRHCRGDGTGHAHHVRGSSGGVSGGHTRPSGGCDEDGATARGSRRPRPGGAGDQSCSGERLLITSYPRPAGSQDARRLVDLAIDRVGVDRAVLGPVDGLRRGDLEDVGGGAARIGVHLSLPWARLRISQVTVTAGMPYPLASKIAVLPAMAICATGDWSMLGACLRPTTIIAAGDRSALAR